MAGVRPATPLTDALDVLEVVLMDTPQDALVKRRRQMDMQEAISQARAGTLDRDSWGMTPEQQAATRPLLSGS